MIALLFQYAIATGCLLFVVSLPLGKLPIASTLRRAAGALFLLALLPSLFFGLLAQSLPSSGNGAGTAPLHGFDLLRGVLGLLVLSALAYAILAIRKRLRTTSKDAWSEFVSLRSSGKRPAGTDPHGPHSSLFDDDARS